MKEAVLSTKPIKVLMVDPSLFTGPYDSMLSEALISSGLDVQWARRELRRGEEADFGDEPPAINFYRATDGQRRRSAGVWKYIKGMEHYLDLRRLERQCQSFDIVHFQWAVLPVFDVPCIRRLRRHLPVVLTVHDTTPFNGTAVNPLQLRGFSRLFEAADHLIVLTESAKIALVSKGVGGQRISVIGHGPHQLSVKYKRKEVNYNPRWRIVSFGRLQTYKGIDVLIEALGRVTRETLERLEIVIAGEPLIDVKPLVRRANELHLRHPTLQFVFKRLSEQEMSELFETADAFVFPYLAIDLSAVLVLVSNYKKWLIASDLGVFHEAIGTGCNRGSLVPPGDIDALAGALAESIGRSPTDEYRGWVPSWSFIASETSQLYQQVLESRGR